MRGSLVMLVGLAGCDAIFLDRSPLEACPAEYARFPGEPTRHRIVSTDATWVVAHSDCVDDSEGLTHLAVIDTFTEIDSIHAHAPVGRILWVGYARDTAAADTTTFFSVTGEPLAPTSSLWSGGEPNNMNGAEVVVGLKDDGFNDDDLTVKKLYVCECDAKPATRTFDFLP